MKMKTEIREDSVVISGYVNAIERFSKPIKDSVRGKVRTFIEKISVGVFKKALQRNDDVKVLLNHKHDRILATTKDGSAILEEDNIGLRAEVTIKDKEVIEKARNNQLIGWSFGFYANSDELGVDGENETRTITDLDLLEISILDDTKSPAYYGTSIEARNDENRILEYRENVKEINFEEKQSENFNDEKLENLIDKVANRILEKINGTGEEKTIPNNTPVEEESRETAKIDYSDFENRIAKLI